LVTADPAGLIELWNVGHEEIHKIRKIGASLEIINRVSISPDGRFVAAAIGDINGAEGQAKVWASETGKELELHGEQHRGGVIAVTFNSSGERMVTASADDTAQVWEVASGQKIGGPLLHTADVLHAAFSADDRFVVTTSMDQTAVIWDWLHGQKLATLQHDSFVNHASFSDDGRYLVTACHDNFARMWYLPGSSSESSADKQMPALIPELVATFEHGGQLQIASFDEQGDRVITIGHYLPELLSEMASARILAQRLIQIRQWNVSPELVTSEQARGCAELISARQFVPRLQDTEELKSEVLVNNWNEWRHVYQQMFASNRDSKRDSYDEEAKECEATGQWYGAVWYLNQLIDRDGSGDSTKATANLLARCARAAN
jgi:hypothetical protein